MKPAERIPLLKKLAQALSEEDAMDWSEMELVLRQFGFKVVDIWPDDDYPSRYNFALHQLEHRGDDDKLLELERYLDPAGESPPAPSTGDGNARTPAFDMRGPWKGEDTFRLFISHTHPHARFAGEMSSHLKKFRIECFVAHDDIEPSEKWQEVIESALLTCHAATALVTTDFRQSVWCDQEVGFCLARALVIVPLMVDIEPHGFLAGFQAVKLPSAKGRGTAWTAAEAVFDILAKRPETQERMVPCVVRRYSASYSFDDSRAVYTQLRRIPKEAWTLELVDEVEKAATENSQIQHANLRTGTPIPEATAKFLAPIKNRLAPEPADNGNPLELEPFPTLTDDDFVPPLVTEADFLPPSGSAEDFVTPSGDDDIPF
jgi:hypothetical protein